MKGSHAASATVDQIAAEPAAIGYNRKLRLLDGQTGGASASAGGTTGFWLNGSVSALGALHVAETVSCFISSPLFLGMHDMGITEAVAYTTREDCGGNRLMGVS